ncbi:hypothetical protein PHLGIDRAFT_12972 [Phlebiopsis gigantea 11061_1 CR5-6]|uniref:Protein kinase domain-containing protein n=1 Tax=Phlebiopsis gigantea (strain 11061_1 CR5-6) TaxID=745531 RepID=A0A0C3S8X9_PHLG1|nr:hypothetical protein PHLGIDRAFT_12972 [Phlebiopsis gigantea 11061_1 CR5-6]
MASSLHRYAMHSKLVSESPMKIPVARSAPPDASVSRHRANILHDLGERVSQIDLQFFYDHLLPPSPLKGRRTPSGVVKKLRKADKIQKQRPGYWADWTKPSSCAENETEVFKKLEDLTKDIRDAANIKGTRTIDFVCNGAISLKSHARDNTSKPDCYAIRYPEAKQRFVKDKVGKYQPLWLDVAVPGEFKKSMGTGTFNDVLWSMHHIMREDARRRFVIGFSIDDYEMRIWYFSRSDAYVSEAFNFLTEHELFVDFVLRVSYAPYHQLGWDSSMTLRTPKDGQELEYDVEVAEIKDEVISVRTFRTVRLLSNIGAETLRGRGTRVWEVAELDDSGKVKRGPTLALKDSWVDDERGREGKIIADILKAAEARGKDSLENLTMKKHLLTTVAFGDVYIDGKVDSTRAWHPPVVTEEIEVKADPSATSKVVSNRTLSAVGAVNVEQTRPSQLLGVEHYSTKVHHRIVFKEVGKTMREVTSLGQGFFCLSQINLVLRSLHSLGWVHRDISCGNVLVVNGVTKLADFEYAKRQEDTNPHGIRTGTSYFMSVEVDQNSYMHETYHRSTPAARDEDHEWRTQLDAGDAWRTEDDRTSDDDTDVTLPSFVPPTTSGSSNDKPGTVPFKHNPLHDLESLFWLGVYILYVGYLVKVGNTSQTDLANQTNAQNRLAANLFRNPTFRARMLMPNNFRVEYTNAHLNPHVQTITDQLDEILKAVIMAFVDAEDNLSAPIPFDIAKRLGLYGTIKKSLGAIIALLATCDITVAIDEASVRRFKAAAIPGDPIPLPDSDSKHDPEPVGHPAKRRKTAQAGGSTSTSRRAANAPTKRTMGQGNAYCLDVLGFLAVTNLGAH